jgi:adenylate cyclase
MAEGSYKRKLAAVFSADVVGYSRLMGEDEAATVKTLETYKGVMSELSRQHRGRVVDSPGDNVLAEFPSVVDAVQCAVAAQNEFKARNTELPENRKMQFRIGINLGDVIEEEGRIYGDGVNIAARLEALADPGGICVSKTAFDHIETKLPLGYEFLGEQEVKNIARPVGAYKVLMEPRVTVRAQAEAKKEEPAIGKARGARRRPVVLGALAAVVVLIGAAVWYFQLRPVGPTVEAARVEKMAHPLPDKPSIAVLPFDNMSRDPEQEYFSDGLAEVIIAALSQIPDLFVIARNSTFTYKGKPVKIQQVSEELGVRYVLEGSVQKSEDRIRITAQLIDALSGKHLWAETYDRQLKDFFAVQDDITMRILKSLHIKLEGEYLHPCLRGTDNVRAYLKAAQGTSHMLQGNIQSNAMARQLFEEAVALDPKYSASYSLIAFTHLQDMKYGSSKSPKESLAKAFELSEKAHSMSSTCPVSDLALSLCYSLNKQIDEAIAACERAINLDPNFSIGYAELARNLVYAGRAKEALVPLQTAFRLDPKPPYLFFTYLAMAYYNTDMHEEAIAASKKALGLAPGSLMDHLWLAVTYSALGREKEARAEIEEARKLNSRMSITHLSRVFPYKNPADLERVLNDLRKAGLPE